MSFPQKYRGGCEKYYLECQGGFFAEKEIKIDYTCIRYVCLYEKQKMR